MIKTKCDLMICSIFTLFLMEDLSLYIYLRFFKSQTVIFLNACAFKNKCLEKSRFQIVYFKVVIFKFALLKSQIVNTTTKPESPYQ
jgi:hypothetical protein